MGQIRGRVTEQQLIQLLEQVRPYRAYASMQVLTSYAPSRPTHNQKRGLRRVQLWCALFPDTDMKHILTFEQYQRRKELEEDGDDFDFDL